jgi:hypothetical protein
MAYPLKEGRDTFLFTMSRCSSAYIAAYEEEGVFINVYCLWRVEWVVVLRRITFCLFYNRRQPILHVLLRLPLEDGNWKDRKQTFYASSIVEN